MTKKFPVKDLNVVLPNKLRDQLPPLPNFVFLPSIDSGSFDESQELLDIFSKADFNLVLGDLSKNSVTQKALSSAYKSSDKPLLITRDSVDAIAEGQVERILMNENIILMASMPQLANLFRAAYYPKIILLSQSLMQVVEILHKFTLSYPVAIITLHNEQIIVAKEGIVKAVSIAKIGLNPLSVWRGELAAKITGLNLYNPNKFIDATIFALFS